MARKYTNIEHNGVIYADASALAAAIGVHPVTVRLHLRHGTMHRLGAGFSGVEPMPVSIRGEAYDSPQAAARKLGVSISHVYRRISEGRPDSIGLPNDRGQHCARSVRIGPVRFRSMAEASRELGFSKGYVGRAFERNSQHMKQRVLAAAMVYAAGRKSGGGAR